MSESRKTKKRVLQPRHRVLREIYRHYLEFRQLVAMTGESVFEHGEFLYDDDGKIIGKRHITISFWDLHNALGKLSERKREAVFYNVILDQKQKDVADIMEITTVSVGQYVEQAMIQLAEKYFAEELNEGEESVADPATRERLRR